MDATNERIIRDIRYYQDRLERYVANKNDEKLLYYIGKLSKLPINTVHLENTGVGRSVNALKKYGGDVSRTAKELVAFWKEMVLQEDKSQEQSQEEPEEEVDSVYSSENDLGNDSGEESRNHEEDPSTNENINCDSNDEETVDGNEEYNELKYKSDESEIHEQSKIKGSSRNDGSKKPHTSKSNSYSTDSDDEISRTSSSIHHSKKRSHTSESSQYEKEEKHKSKKVKHDESHSSHERKSTSSKDESNSKYKSRKDNSDKSKEKKSESKREKEHKSENGERKSSSHSDKSESSKSKSSSSDKHNKSDKVKDDSKKSLEASSSKHHQDRDKKEKHSSKSSKERDTEKIISKHKSSKKDKHSKEKKTKVVKDTKKGEIVHGIGSDSGASFAEALGMCGPSVSKKKSSSSNSSKPKPSSSDKDRTVDSPPTNKSSTSHSKIDHEVEDHVPELLKEPQLEPLNINISSLLPEITPNYKPLGFPLDCQQKRFISDDEALCRVMSNKNQRTKVYSGNKTVMKVESLFQICIRILQDNIDALEYTGGVPYLILKPILEKATPDQLFNMEHHNPYLIEDTDELWKLHCQREFKTKKRQEMESWRDMYMRCLDEREARLNFITANIKQSQDKSVPIRTTKLAYVDSFVKPPRNIARQQAKHGTSSVKSSASTKLVALAKSGEAGKVAVPNPGSRAADRSSSLSTAAPVKPKKAPLMAKTLSFLKNRFRR